MESRITDVRIVNDKETGEVSYSALIDNSKLVQYSTDGKTKRHLNERLWLEYVKSVMNNLKE